MTDGTPNNPYFLTLGEAAQQTGFSKSKISRDIRDGKLSVREKSLDTGSFKIDPAELTRYADAQKVLRATAVKAVEEHRVTPGSATGNTPATGYEARLEVVQERHRAELAEERFKSIKTQLEEMATQRDDARRERDEWRKQAQTAMLTFQGVQEAAKAAAPPVAATPAPEPRRGFLGLFRRAG